MAKRIKIIELRDITPPGLDGFRFRISWELSESEGTDFESNETGRVTVTISRTLQTMWGVSEENIAIITGSATLPYLIDNARNNNLRNFTEIELNSLTAERNKPAIYEDLLNRIWEVSDTTNLEL